MINNEIFKRDIAQQKQVPVYVFKILKHLQANILSSVLEKCVSSPSALQSTALCVTSAQFCEEFV